MGKTHVKLTGRIIEKYGSRKAFAQALGIKETTLSIKLGGKSDFKESEIRRSMELLEIPAKEVGTYFFDY